MGGERKGEAEENGKLNESNKKNFKKKEEERKHPTELPADQSYGNIFLIESPFSQMTLASVELT